MSSIRFLLFEIKRVLVFNLIIIYFTDLFMFYIFILNAYANKKVFKKKGWKIMFNGSNCDRKSHLSGILTEPLNPREILHVKLNKIEIKVLNVFNDNYSYLLRRTTMFWIPNVYLNTISSLIHGCKNKTRGSTRSQSRTRNIAWGPGTIHNGTLRTSILVTNKHWGSL